MRRILVSFVLVAALAGAALLLFSERIWEIASGPADQGPVEFGSISRPDSPNTFLACASSLCAAPDLAVEPLAGTPEEAIARLAALIEADGAERVDDGSDPLGRRYVVRTAILRFPDTVNVMAAPADAGAAIAIYSRSLVGYDDFDVNEERVTRWLGALR